MIKRRENINCGEISRRNFLCKAGAVSASTLLAGSLSSRLFAKPKPAEKKMIWANLLHLSTNMWEDNIHPKKFDRGYRPYLRFDKRVWDDILVKMADVGMNTVVIDLGDGVQYQSHPEIPVKGAWSISTLKKELAKMRKMGLEPIPKLNFATTHDAWLGEYSRCVSTDKYYGVCKDLIAEVIDLFDTPRLFHLGMDEETIRHQKYFKYASIRQFELWWHDLYFYVDQVTKGGSRPWIWSDFMWYKPDEFFQKMPKEVVQSNWYYTGLFEDAKKSLDKTRVKAYIDMEEHGYDQIPTGCNKYSEINFSETVRYCKKHIDPERLLGFLITPWKFTFEKDRKSHMDAVEKVKEAMAKFKV